jgi:mono/diheme cytochrome c family protein
MKRFCIALLLVCAANATGRATESGQQRGKALLEAMCARCHAIGKTGQSPHQDAPPFRTFGDDKLYDNDFGQRLQGGLSTIHPDMPTFHFSREDADAAVNYLRSIQVRSKPNTRR